MNQILQITDYAKQKQSIVLPDGSSFSLSLYYSTRQNGWFIDELIYKTFTLRGTRICNSPNILHQFANKLPFGIACFSKNDIEPYFQRDFLDGNSALYLLSATEVATFEAYLVQ